MADSTARDDSFSSSTTGLPPWNYHVYLSFRGIDTRKGFVGHLYAALQKKGLITFIDDELERGEDIKSALIQAIETSLCTIVIFSENFAASSWCLDELQTIVECQNKLGRLVVPVFYHVDPSDVRYQKGSFGKAFAKHDKRFAEDKIQNWRSVLYKVAALSGWHTGDSRSEARLIEDIASTLWQEMITIEAIRSKSPSESDLLVKIQAMLSDEVTNFMSKRLRSDKIKQSLVNFAKAQAKSSGKEWNYISENISCLIDEAKEHFSLGREIINVILKELETMTDDYPFVHEQPISSEKRIIYFMQSYQESGRNNAFVTVIAGDDKSQNTTLAGNVYKDETMVASFKPRGWVKFSVDQLVASNFIKSILESFNAGFDDGDDLQALMTQLRECLRGKKFLLVLDGFDSLENWEIFKKCLEVAERGSSIILTAQKADITKIADCTYFPEQDEFFVSEAVRADLNLSEMESSDLPESIYEQYSLKSSTSFGSSYLSKQPEMILEEDVIPEEGHEDAIVTNKETDILIEGLAHAPELQSPLTGDNLATNSDDVIEAVRAADHQEASDKDAEALRAADNQEVSTAEILGVDDQPEDSSDQDTFDFFSSLETIKVSHAFQLKELPQKLYSLRIVECHFLDSLAAELENQSLSLSELYMIDCGFLKDFVDEKYCTSLTTLYINKCRKLKFPLSLLTTQTFACLKHLSIGNSCDSLESFTLDLFPKLKTLCIWGCENLKSLSVSEGFQNDNLKLESLELWNCPKLALFPAKGLPARSLKSIRFSNCKNLQALPNNMASLGCLQSIILERCPKLESFPAGGLPSSLNLLSIAFCDKLTPQKECELHRCHSLSCFEIESGCAGMKSFPDKDLLPKNLISLRISKLLSLTSLDFMGLQDLTSLESLEINSCQKLYSLPDEGFASSLKFLCINECPMLSQKLIYKAGAEWQKIARIPKIQINGELISSNSTRGYSISGNGII